MNASAMVKPQYHTETDLFNHCEAYPDERCELIHGDIIAMAGASRNHNVITQNFSRELGNHLKHAPYMPFTSNFFVQCGDNVYLPDVVVDCGTDNERYATQPLLIIEVVSKSTRHIDFAPKLNDYQKIPTLQEYAIVEQDVMRVYLFRRKDHWQGAIYNQGAIYFESIDLTLAISEIYHRVVLNEF